jgi:hypothetical protein
VEKSNATVAIEIIPRHPRGGSQVKPERLGASVPAKCKQGAADYGRRVERNPEVSLRIGPSDPVQVNGDGANVWASRTDRFRNHPFATKPAGNDVGNGVGSDRHGRVGGRLGTGREPR